MDYQIDLTWDAAAALAEKGAWIRRWAWLDRWLFLMAGVWWLKPSGDDARVVRATDFTEAEFRAGDYTTMWPDQVVCLPQPPPEPAPQPEPGGPIVQHHYFSVDVGPLSNGGGRGRQYGHKAIVNPFGKACLVRVQGQVDDGLSFNGSAVPPVAPHYEDFTFILGAGEVFTVAAVDWNRGGASYDLTVTFTP